MVLYLPRLESWAVTRVAGGCENASEGLEQPHAVPATSRRPDVAAVAVGDSPRLVACSPRMGGKAFSAAASPFG